MTDFPYESVGAFPLQLCNHLRMRAKSLAAHVVVPRISYKAHSVKWALQHAGVPFDPDPNLPGARIGGSHQVVGGTGEGGHAPYCSKNSEIFCPV
jgi:hypothetical protein